MATPLTARLDRERHRVSLTDPFLQQEGADLPGLSFRDAPHHRSGQVVRFPARVSRWNNNIVEVLADQGSRLAGQQLARSIVHRTNDLAGVYVDDRAGNAVEQRLRPPVLDRLDRCKRSVADLLDQFTRARCLCLTCQYGLLR
ncbi:MAG: hypothetical protein IH960_07190 [Chloroflexi bacterium]|nr:hypothetical protein [Chloroflexota bacterium]